NHRGRMPADHDFAYGFAAEEIDHGDRTFIGDKPHRINTDARAATGRACDAVGFRTPATPVADISFASDDDDIVRSDADFETPPELSGFRIEFEQFVRKIADDVKELFVRGEKQARGDFGLALRKSCVRQGPTGDAFYPRLFHRKNLDAAVDAAQENALAVT